MALVLTLLGISLLIVLHEFGHFLAAVACNMRVLRFSLGFGPILIQRTYNGTIWQLAALPLGGFVQIAGMGPTEEDNTALDDPQSYRNKPAWQRAMVIAAGPLANWLITAGLLAFLAGTTGFRQYDETQPVLGELVATGPAAQAGLLEKDRVVVIEGIPVNDWHTLVQAIRSRPGIPTHLTIVRGNQTLDMVVTPKVHQPGNIGVIEAAPIAQLQKFKMPQALLQGLQGAWQASIKQGQLLLGLFTGQGNAQLTGLPGIVKSVSQQAKHSTSHLLEALAGLSIGLFLMNILPIPALDGSRLLFIVLEILRRKPVAEALEGKIHTAGFLLMLGLMLFVSVRDLLPS